MLVNAIKIIFCERDRKRKKNDKLIVIYLWLYFLPFFTGWLCRICIKMEKIAYSTSPILLAAIRHDQNQASNLNIKLICQNNSVVMASGLLMGAICPVLRNIGKTENEFDNLDVFLPDHGANQVQSFLKTLVSEQGPKSFEEHAIFTELLNLLAKDTGV